MKTKLILSLFALTCHSVYSQEVFPAAKVHPEWNVQRRIQPSLPGPVYLMNYHLEKDSTINQNTYSLISRSGNQEPGKLYEHIGFIRADSKKVFFRKPGQEKEYLLYDFGLQVGDTVYCPYYQTDSARYRVLSVDSLTINGIKRLHLKVKPEGYYIDSPNTMDWIEGIGNLQNPFYYESFDVSGFSDEVRCISVDSGLLYANPNYDNCTTVLKQTDLIVRDGVIWSGMYIYKDHLEKDSVESYHIKFEGDTLLNDRIYTKIMESRDSLGVNWKITGLIREAEKRVYYHKLGENGFNDMILYDFSVHAGNSLLLASIESPGIFSQMLVTNVDSLEVSGIKRLRIQLSTGEGKVNTWIEKIGSLQGILNPCYKAADPKKVLLCVSENGNTIYSSNIYPHCYYSQNGLTNTKPVPLKNEILVYPNPVKNKFYIENKSEQQGNLQVLLLDLNGRVLYRQNLNESLNEIDVSSYPAGLYFIQVKIDNFILNGKVIKQ